jgi:Xaa-Pro aminopeptidase
VKTAVEIQKLRAAAAITDKAMAQVNQLARPGMTEKELAWALERQMREDGADGMAFPVIVASGPNSALPHHQTSNRRLQVGDVIIVDMGAELNGYKSDMTRSFYLGDEPTEKFWEIYNLVLAAHTAVFDQLRPGMTLRQIDSIARDLITAAGQSEHFGHGLGHGVGLDIHEAPFLSQRAPKEARIQAGMTVTIEPGIYIPGWGGIRIEDFAWVTKNGLEQISHCPKTAVISLSDWVTG